MKFLSVVRGPWSVMAPGLIVFFSVLTLLSASAQEEPTVFSPEALQDATRLVAELRQFTPDLPDVRATLRIRRRGGETWNVPVRFAVTRDATSVRTRYSVTLSSRNPAEELVVVQHDNGSVEYLHGTSEDGTAPILGPADASKLDRPLGGSDFTLGSLGLDFARWPGQKLLPSEMRLGRRALVLESTRTGDQELVRVRSWIDRETGGILVAEGYDKGGRLVKEFTLSGSSFVKIDGGYQIRELKMRTPPARSETVLEFDLPGR